MTGPAVCGRGLGSGRGGPQAGAARAGAVHGGDSSYLSARRVELKPPKQGLACLRHAGLQGTMAAESDEADQVLRWQFIQIMPPDI
jgi:hypothetical protein